MNNKEIYPISVVYDVSYMASAEEVKIETIVLPFFADSTLQKVFEAIEESNRRGYTLVGNIKLIKHQ